MLRSINSSYVESIPALWWHVIVPAEVTATWTENFILWVRPW